MRRLLSMQPKTGVNRLTRWRTGMAPIVAADPINPITLSPSVWYDVNDSELYQYWEGIASVANGDSTVTGGAGAFSITIPTGTSKISIQAWGGGESGVGDDGVAQGGAGGGGGAFGTSTNVSVTAGTTYTGSVGAGGAAVGTGVQPNAGGSTSITIAATVYSVPGGSGTLGGLFASGSGFASGFNGGNGGGATSTGGGGGGGSAGTAANGNDGKTSTTSTGGAGGVAVTGGAAGGAGGDNTKNGTAGDAPGGGGGGMGYQGTTSGAGGDGSISLTFANTGITVSAGSWDAIWPVSGQKFKIYGSSVSGYNTTGTIRMNGQNAYPYFKFIGSTAYISSTGASGSVAGHVAGGGDRLAFIGDLSGNANHLKTNTQSSRVQANDFGHGISGASSTGVSFTTALSALSAFTFLAVVRSVGAAFTLFEKSTNGEYIRVNANGTIEVKMSTSTTTTSSAMVTAYMPTIIAVTLNGGTMTIRASGNLSYSAGATGDIDLDRLDGSGAGNAGAFKDAVLYSSALTTAQVNGVAAWLSARYGVAW